MREYTKQEKQSATITFVIFLMIFLPLIFLRYTITDPDPLEALLALEEGGGGGGGVAIDFGDSEVGAGIRELSQVKSSTASAPAVSAPSEEVVGSSDDEAEAVANTKPVQNKDPRMENAKPETPKKPVVPAKPTNAALDNLLRGADSGGDGNTGQSGNQGRSNGISNGGYDGDGGSGGGRGGGTGSGNGTGTGPGSGSGSGGGSGGGRGTGVGDYNLSGRKMVARKSPQYTCNEEGRVVVQITVDQSGKVIAAVPGARGTTNPARCLADQAKDAAMSTKFDAKPDAPEKQTGTIIYNFKLTE